MREVLKTKMPWYTKMAAKVVLSHLPVDYSFWKRCGLFEHGSMEDPSYAYDVFKIHFDRVNFSHKKKGFVSLELGPGDSLFSAMIVHALGGKSTYLIDVKHFANHNLKPYQSMANFLLERGLPAVRPEELSSLEELLTLCGAHYKTNGLESLRVLRCQHIDFIWSQAVLEHIRKSEFFEYMKELRRVIKNDGVCSFRIDLRDHLGGVLNNLRFSERTWESHFLARSGFYTNRIRYSEMISLFKKAGFNVHVVNVNRWEELPTPRVKLADGFRHLSDDELCVSGFDVILRPVSI